MSSPETTHHKPVKLATKSAHASYFMPMLQSLADKDELNEVVKNCVVKSCELMDAGVPLHLNGFVKTHDAGAIRAEYEACSATELEELNESFTCAGRIISHRSFGKVAFFHLMDRSGRIQCYASKDLMGEEAYKNFKKFDIGDIVGVHGKLFRTKTDELTLACDQVTLLTKSFRSLPEKHKGLTNVEIRYRQRYVDLITNPKVRDIFRKRSKIIRTFRAFLEERGFVEVETPMLHPVAGGAAARPFITHHNALDMELYMRIAPELYLKRLLVGGFEKVFELNRNFRNEGISIRHNPEFTMCEFYWAYATFYDLMDLTEELFSTIATEVCGSPIITYQGTELDLTPGKWQRLTFHESLEKIGGHSPEFYNDFDKVLAYVRERGEKILKTDKLGKLQAKLFDLDVEPKLVAPTFIYHYPTEISPLARRNKDNPDITDRFELFIMGREYGNAFSELNDPIDQRGRFEHELALREMGNDEAGMMDEDFINALEYGLPPTGGMGIGIDRCVMLLTDSDSIRDVILFPTMKPLDKPESAKRAAAGTNCAVPAAEQGPVDFSKVEIEPLFQEFVDFETFAKSDFRAVKVKECTAVPKSKKLLKFVLDDGTGEDRVILSGIHDTYEPEELVGKTLIAITNLPPRKMMGIDSCGMIISAVHHEEGVEKLHCLMVDDHIPAGAKLY